MIGAAMIGMTPVGGAAGAAASPSAPVVHTLFPIVPRRRRRM